MNGTLYLKRFDTAASCDVTEDFTLPDYQPEVRRVVGVRALATVDGKYLSGDELEADGGVTYTLLYIGGDGGLYQTSQTSPYTAHIPAKSEDDRFSVSDIVLSCAAENVSVRVTAPRRISLSSRVRLTMMSQKPMDAEMKADGKVRSLTDKHKCAYITELRHTSEAEGELHEREGMRVVMANAEICIADVRMNADRALVKGDAYVSLSLVSPEGEYSLARKGVPIEEEIALPEAARDTESYATAFAVPIMLEVESAEDGGIKWRMEYDIDLDVMRCSEATVTRDAYLTDTEDSVKTAEYEAYYPAATVNGRLTSSATVKQRAGSRPVCAWGTATAEKCGITGGRAVMGGTVKLSVLTDVEGELVTDEVSVPLRYECDAVAGCADTDDSALARRMSVSVNDVSTRGDGDNIHITAELAISAIALGMQRVACVQSISPADGAKKCESGGNVIRVYAPGESESSWDVEKRFRLSGEAQREGEFYII